MKKTTPSQSPQPLKEIIDAQTRQVRENTARMNELGAQMDIVASAIRACQLVRDGLRELGTAYEHAQNNDFAGLAPHAGILNDFCSTKLPRLQQYWVDLNNERASIVDKQKTLMFTWEDNRSKYNRMMKKVE